MQTIVAVHDTVAFILFVLSRFYSFFTTSNPSLTLSPAQYPSLPRHQFEQKVPRRYDLSLTDVMDRFPASSSEIINSECCDPTSSPCSHYESVVINPSVIVACRPYYEEDLHLKLLVPMSQNGARLAIERRIFAVIGLFNVERSDRSGR